MSWILVSVLLVWTLGPAAAAPSTIDITVPESAKVEGEDSYICITKPLPDKPLKLVGVEPMAEQKVVHHILLFGKGLAEAAAVPCRQPLHQAALPQQQIQTNVQAICTEAGASTDAYETKVARNCGVHVVCWCIFSCRV